MTARAAVLLVSLSAGLAALARPARADAVEDARRQAQTLLAEGAALYRQGDHAAALAKFTEAHGRFASPKIFFNIGQANRALHRPVEALEAFQRFLREARDLAPETRQEAERAVAALLPEVARIDVEADVEGATLSIDGRDHGTVPRLDPALVMPGPHELVVEKAGHPAYRDRFEARAGESRRFSVRLQALAAPGRTTPAPAPPVALHAATGGKPARLAPRTWAAIAVGTVGAAAVATGLVFGLNARASGDDVQQACGGTTGCTWDGTQQERQVAGRRNERLQWWLLGTGAAALGAAAALAFWPGSSEGVRVTWLGDGAAVSAQGRF